MKNSLETRLGVFVAMAMIAAFLVLEIIGDVDFFKPSFHARARFNDIQQLKVGDPVKMAGVPVGRVEKVGLADGKVELEMRLNRGTPVHTDTKASIKFAGLMGINYVALDFGTPNAPALEDNQLLSVTEQPDMNTLMTKLDDVATGVQNLTKSFTGDKIDNLLGPFTDFMKQNNAHITAIIGNVQSITGQISKGEGTVGKLIYQDTLYNSALASVTNLQDVAVEIKDTVARARAVVDQINSGQGTVGKLIKDETLYRDTTASMTNLKEILQKINNGQGTVGKVINDPEMYKNAKLSLQKMDKLADSLEDTGPLSLLGSVITTLF